MAQWQLSCAAALFFVYQWNSYGWFGGYASPHIPHVSSFLDFCQCLMETRTHMYLDPPTLLMVARYPMCVYTHTHVCCVTVCAAVCVHCGADQVQTSGRGSSDENGGCERLIPLRTGAL